MQLLFFAGHKAIIFREMSERIGQLTDAVPFTRTFISSISELPLDLLRAEEMFVY